MRKLLVYIESLFMNANRVKRIYEQKHNEKGKRIYASVILSYTLVPSGPSNRPRVVCQHNKICIRFKNGRGDFELSSGRRRNTERCFVLSHGSLRRVLI